MQLSNFETMNPDLLVGLVNTELRNQCEDLDGLCAMHDLDQARLIERLASANYHYLPEQQRFS